MSESWVGVNVPNPVSFVENSIGLFDPVVNTISIALDIIAVVINILSSLVATTIDPIVAVLNQLVEEIIKILDDVSNLGFSMLYYQQSFDSPAQGRGYQKFISDLRASLLDPKDKARPIIEENTPIFALSAMLGINSLSVSVDELDKFNKLLGNLSGRYKNVFNTYIPQAKGFGVVSGCELTKEVDADTNVEYLKISEGKISIAKDFFQDTQLAIPFLQKAAVLDTLEEAIVMLAPAAVNLIVFGSFPEALGFPQASFIPVASVKFDDKSNILDVIYNSDDLIKRAEYGRSLVFLGLVTTDATGNILAIDSTFRVPVEEKEVLQNAANENYPDQPPDWVGQNLRDWEPYQQVIQNIEGLVRQMQPPITGSKALEDLATLITNIKNDLQSVSAGLKQAAKSLNDSIGALGGLNGLFVTPWPVLITGPDPYNLSPGDTFKLKMDAVSAATSPTGASEKNIVVEATQGLFTTGNAVNYTIPATVGFHLNAFIREASVSGSAAPVLGMTPGNEISFGSYQSSSDSRVFTIPDPSGAVRLSLLGTGISFSPNPNTLALMLGFNPGTTQLLADSFTGIDADRYHFNSNNSMRVSIWTKNMEFLPAPNNVLPFLGWQSATFDSNKLEGVDTRDSIFIPSSQMQLTTFSSNRIYNETSLRNILGFDNITEVSSFVDRGRVRNQIYFKDAGGFKIGLAVKEISDIQAPLDLLGLNNPITSLGVIQGVDPGLFNILNQSLIISARSKKINVTQNSLAQTLGFNQNVYIGSFNGSQSRLFTWAPNSGFTIIVNSSTGILFSGNVSIPVGRTNVEGSVLANEITIRLRNITSAPNSVFCFYEASTGLFEFFLGSTAVSVEFTALVNNLLPDLGITPNTSINLTSGSFIAQEPSNYVVSEPFVIKLGNESNSIPLSGRYTGTALASDITQQLSMLGYTDVCTYDLTTGTFTYVSNQDYEWYTGVEVLIPDLNSLDANSVVASLNANFDIGALSDATEAFFFDNVFKYRQEGLTQFEIITDNPAIGFNTGVYPVTDDVFSGSAYKGIYLDFEFSIKVNRTVYPVIIPPDYYSLDTLAAYLNNGNYSVTNNNGLRFVVNNSLPILVDHPIYFGPDQTFTNLELTTYLDTEITTALFDQIVVQLISDTLIFTYPNLSNITFNALDVGYDYRDVLGLVIGSSNVDTTYVGNSVKRFYLNNMESFNLLLGTQLFNIIIPTSGYFTGTSLANTLSTAFTTVQGSWQYDSVFGLFTVGYASTGFLQIDSQIISISQGVYSPIQIASILTQAIRSATGALGTEVCAYINNRFVLLDSNLVSVNIQETVSPNLNRLLGMTTGSVTASFGRVQGSEPKYYFIGASNSFNYKNDAGTYLVTLPISTDFLSGFELSQVIQTEVRSLSGLLESVTYNAGIFTQNADPIGVKVLDDYEVILPPQTGFVGGNIIAQDIESDINTFIPTLGIDISYDGLTRGFTFSHPALSQIEFIAGNEILPLHEMLGFNLGIVTSVDNKIVSAIGKNYIVDIGSNQLRFTLGNTFYDITLTPDNTFLQGSEIASIVQDAIRQATNRLQTVSYSDNKFTLGIDPQGEYLIDPYEYIFAGNATISLLYIAQELTNTMRALPGATGDETFIIDFASQLLGFQTISLRAKTILVEPIISAQYDLTNALGLVTRTLGENDSNQMACVFNPYKNHIITTDNNVLSLDLNRTSFNITIDPNDYTGDELVTQIKSKIDALYPNISPLSELNYLDGYFTFVSDEEGFKYLDSDIFFTGLVFADVNAVASELQSIIRNVSTDQDEVVGFFENRFYIQKPNLIKLQFLDLYSVDFLFILKALGIEATKFYEASSTGLVTLDEIAPFNIVSGQNKLSVIIDNLDLGFVEVPEQDVPLKGSELSELLKTGIQNRLKSFILRDMLYRYTSPFIINLDPTNPEFVVWNVSARNLDAIRTRVVEDAFNFQDAETQQNLASFINPATSVEIPIFQAIAAQANLIAQDINRISGEIRRVGQKRELASLIDVTLTRLLATIPYSIVDIEQVLLDNISASLDSAATLLNKTISPNLKNLLLDRLFFELRQLFATKYFFNAEVEYTTDSTFIFTSPSYGLLSRVGILPYDTDTLYSHIGLGAETLGTGNVGLAHRVIALELAAMVVESGFVAYPWGQSSFRPAQTYAGELQPADITYPHRLYTPDEMSFTATTQIHYFSLNYGNTASLQALDVVGNPVSKIGIPTTEEVGNAGQAGFVGAFEKAGIPEGIREDAYIFAFIFALVAVGGSGLTSTGLQDAWNKLAGITGLPIWQ